MISGYPSRFCFFKDLTPAESVERVLHVHRRQHTNPISSFGSVSKIHYSTQGIHRTYSSPEPILVIVKWVQSQAFLN